MQTLLENSKTTSFTKSEKPILLKRTIIELAEKEEQLLNSTTKQNTTPRYKYPTNGLYGLL